VRDESERVENRSGSRSEDLDELSGAGGEGLFTGEGLGIFGSILTKFNLVCVYTGG
jgi:hypothetical protein